MPSVSAMRAAARGWAVGDVQLADGGDEGLQGLVVEREGADEEARVAKGDEAEAVVRAAGDEVAEDALGNGEAAFAAQGRYRHAAGGVEDEGDVDALAGQLALRLARLGPRPRDDEQEEGERPRGHGRPAEAGGR